ncbi:N-acetylmuramoyl-L-alanine amidase [Corynebacterium choanae]|uniref:N-acetylmuramoyl-L-alanine amidase n=1 Tax=Corynebacterium choanae TaxID=1862358 RepID=A0A3G6J398_9CORY|nr:N-acetylmuramoyl-L-alanine amidase [Corynebacterium choanae]AZA12535.1 N-acetylmuramoyl-L-alanine amidase [Corynebacterium choanae]
MPQRRRITTYRKPVTAWVTAAAVAFAGGGVMVLGNHEQSQVALAGDNDPLVDAVRLAAAPYTEGLSVALEHPLLNDLKDVLDTYGLLPEDAPQTITEFTREEPFTMFALTWKGSQDLNTFVRALQEDGTWSQWYAAPTLNRPDGQDAAGDTNGTQMIYLPATTKVQVATQGVAPATDEQPTTAVDAGLAPEELTPAPAVEPATDLPVVQAPPVELPEPEPAQDVVIPPIGETPAAPDYDISQVPAVGEEISRTPLGHRVEQAEPVSEALPPANPADMEAIFVSLDPTAIAAYDLAGVEDDLKGIPRIITRQGWAGAGATKKCNQVDGEVNAIAINATGGSNEYTPEDVPAMLRAIYDYQTTQLGWCDIGANAYVDQFGRIFEGRAGGLTKAVRGQHTAGFNENTWGVTLMGDFATIAPSQQAVDATAELAGWRSHVAGFTPDGSDTHTSEGNSKYPEGTTVVLPNIFASAEATGVADGTLSADLPEIRRKAKAHYDQIVGGSFDSQANNLLQEFRKKQQQLNAAKKLTGTVKNNPSTAANSLISALAGWDTKDGSSQATTLDNTLSKPGNQQVLQIVGTLAAAAVTMALARGVVPEQLQGAGNKEVARGVKLADVPVLITKVVALGGDTKYSRTWNQINSTFGPVLGKVLGAETKAVPASAQNSEISYIPFEHGLIVSSPEAGTHGIWGEIGNAWAAAGFDASPLGLPINEEHLTEEGLIRTDFQGGYITFNPATGDTEIRLPNGDLYDPGALLANIADQLLQELTPAAAQ